MTLPIVRQMTVVYILILFQIYFDTILMPMPQFAV